MGRPSGVPCQQYSLSFHKAVSSTLLLVGGGGLWDHTNHNPASTLNITQSGDMFVLVLTCSKGSSWALGHKASDYSQTF